MSRSTVYADLFGYVRNGPINRFDATGSDTKELLMKEIVDAFADSSYPGDNNIIDPSGYMDFEAEDTQKFFKGKHWKELSLELLLDRHSDLSFMSPEAFCFYLPAYMIASLDDDADLISDTPASLTPLGADSGRISTRVHRFTKAQAEAIISYLKYLIAEDPTDNMLRRALKYWNSIDA